MPRFARVILPAAAIVVAGLFVSAAPASAATVDVFPGQSIQQAINSSPHGSTINVHAGTYHETVLVRKDGITLQGAGNNASGTILVPPANGNSICGEGPGSFPGICVLAKELDADFNIITPVYNVTVDGFLIRNFPSDGLVSFGASKATFTNDTSSGNAGYGITSFVSSGNVFDHLKSLNNGAPGFYIGDSPNASFHLTNSLSDGNQLGLFIREANFGTINDNVFQNNCAGIFMLNHGGPPGQNQRVSGWSIHDNQVLHNNKDAGCGGDEGPPSGIGIAVGGAKNTSINHNIVNGNQGPANTPAGGIVVFSTKASDGGDDPVNISVTNNTARYNRPFDIRNDGTGSGNTYTGNTCNTSDPGSYC